MYVSTGISIGGPNSENWKAFLDAQQEAFKVKIQQASLLEPCTFPPFLPHPPSTGRVSSSPLPQRRKLINISTQMQNN